MVYKWILKNVIMGAGFTMFRFFFGIICYENTSLESNYEGYTDMGMGMLISKCML